MLPPPPRLPRKCDASGGVDGDETVRWTNDDATVSKLSCVELKYLNDNFVKHFVRRRQKKPPLINRGYFSRVYAIHSLIRQFLEAFKESSTQIISLGCGFDTTFFQFKEENRAPSMFIEIDFEEVTHKKCGIIERTPEMMALLESRQPDQPIVVDKMVLSRDYSLVASDLRNLTELEAALTTAGFNPEIPTLVLAECVLVYLEPAASAALLSKTSALLPSAPAVFILYEQIHPDDAFGKQMCKNLESRGILLPGLEAHPDLDAQQRRFLDAGWQKAAALDMHNIHHHRLHPPEVQRINRLEIFDEFEEWQLIQSHYCIAHAVQHDSQGALSKFGLFSDDAHWV